MTPDVFPPKTIDALIAAHGIPPGKREAFEACLHDAERIYNEVRARQQRTDSRRAQLDELRKLQSTTRTLRTKWASMTPSARELLAWYAHLDPAAGRWDEDIDFEAADWPAEIERRIGATVRDLARLIDEVAEVFGFEPGQPGLASLRAAAAILRDFWIDGLRHERFGQEFETRDDIDGALRPKSPAARFLYACMQYIDPAVTPQNCQTVMRSL